MTYTKDTENIINSFLLNQYLGSNKANNYPNYNRNFKN